MVTEGGGSFYVRVWAMVTEGGSIFVRDLSMVTDAEEGEYNVLYDGCM